MQNFGLRDKLLAVFLQMVRESDVLPLALVPVIEKLVRGYLQKATDEDVRKIIIQLRDEFIPELLKDGG